jgi:acyl carrier protein
MLKKMFVDSSFWLARFILSFRYKVTIKGLDQLNQENLTKSGGILFLPNHPTVFVDPTLIAATIWRKQSIRPIIVEYMYYMPIVNGIMRLLRGIPVPNFVSASNSLKKKKADRVMEVVIEDLKNGDNFLIYPGAKVKHQAREIVAASGVHRILQSVPEANVVLVRVTGLWGSRFSRALTGKTPPMFPTLWWGVKQALKNLIFFTPRRHLTIEFQLANSNFPYQGTRLEMNRYLEKWYNRPDGILPQTGEEPGESLYLVPYSAWSKELPQLKALQQTEQEIHIDQIPDEVQQKIKNQLAEMSHRPADQIKPEMDLGADLGFDSLDNAEIIAFLDDQFDVSRCPVSDLTTVGQVMGIASKQLEVSEQPEEEAIDLSAWSASRPHQRATIAKGETIPEVFLNRCQEMKKEIACGDEMAGVLTYAQAKMRVILLAEYIRHLPSEYIGIMLPSSVTAYLTILACQLAGKIPLLVNWTVGARHLESVVNLSKVQVVLSSWAFIDRLENVDLTGIEDLIVMLEDARQDFSLKDKLKAFYRSKLSTSSVLSIFNAQKISKDAEAVLLFTSGTENLPKGVPLSHENILSNQKGSIEKVALFQDDVLLGMLPPFHAFGFTLSGLLPLLCGLRVVYFPDPTNGKGVAHCVEKWQATLLCGAPTFLRGIFKNGSAEQLKTVRLCFTGAEKAPPELFQYAHELGHCKMVEGYGITECSPVMTINITEEKDQGVGQPIAGLDLCVVDLDHHQPVEAGKQGLILAKGTGVFKGYLNKGITSPFLSVEGQQWYSTGDLGYLTTKGALVLSGRFKRFVKIGGEMISLAAIESTLQHAFKNSDFSHEGPELAVCAKEEPGERAKIFVFTCLTLELEQVNRAIKEAGFSNLVKISKVEKVKEIPLMGSGKINYRALDTQMAALLEKPETVQVV